MSPSERALLIFPFFTGFSSFGASSSGDTSTRLSLEFFCYSFFSMPIVQPHENKFRVFLLIAQLMVRKLFLGAHFKMPFCWLSSLDVSIHQREIADYCLCIFLMCLDIIIKNQQKNYQKWQMWQKLIVLPILTSHSSLGSTRTSFPQLSAQINATNSAATTVSVMISVTAEHVPTII